jgi:hypothetical protein
MRPYNLPDGAEVWAGIIDESGGDVPELGPVWEVQLPGARRKERVIR